MGEPKLTSKSGAAATVCLLAGYDTLNIHEDIVTTPLKVSENRSCGPRTEFSAIADENGFRHSSDSNIICALDKIIVSKFVRADSEFCSKNLRRFSQCRAIHNTVTWSINHQPFNGGSNEAHRSAKPLRVGSKRRRRSCEAQVARNAKGKGTWGERRFSKP